MSNSEPKKEFDISDEVFEQIMYHVFKDGLKNSGGKLKFETTDEELDAAFDTSKEIIEELF